MPLLEKYLAIMARLGPAASAIGLSAVLGAAGAAGETLPRTDPPFTTKDGVAEQLAAVRDAVSTIGESQRKVAGIEGRLAWYNWHNWGWGWSKWPNWNNWANWRNY